MRHITYAAAVLLLAALASAQSINSQAGSSQPSTALQSSQSAAKPDVQAQLDAIERKLTELEKRVNEVLPASGSDAAQHSVTDRLDSLEKNLLSLEQPLQADQGQNGGTERLDALDQRLQLLEQHNANVEEGPTVTAGRDTFSITSPDKKFRLRFGGHFQLDGKEFSGDTAPAKLADNFIVRRARPILEGDLGDYISFRLMPDFGNGQALLYDAYADLKVAGPVVVLRGGKFKDPIGLELLQNDADRTFIESALPSDLVPNRTEGFQLYGNIANRLGYNLALVDGAPDGVNIDGSTINGRDSVARIFATPFQPGGPRVLKGFGFGIGVGDGNQNGGTLYSLKSTGGQAVFYSFATNAYAAGNRLTYMPQAYYYNGPFGVMAEYAVTSQRIGLKSVTHEIDDHAWQVAGSWVLTGENKSYRSVIPRQGLETRNDGLGKGAWELVGRYTELNVDPMAFRLNFANPAQSAEAARAWCTGINWYLNYFTKLQFEYENTHFQRGAVKGNRPTENAVMERVQLAF